VFFNFDLITISIILNYLARALNDSRSGSPDSNVRPEMPRRVIEAEPLPIDIELELDSLHLIIDAWVDARYRFEIHGNMSGRPMLYWYGKKLCKI
jgi:hypothetical protein